MRTQKEMLCRLQQEISQLQGHKPLHTDEVNVQALGQISRSFPQGIFPLKAVHEFLYPDAEGGAASAAFVAGLLGSVVKQMGICIWISPVRQVFPPALKAFGLDPHKIIFLHPQNQRHLIWALEEALRFPELTAVIAELSALGFTESRRLQLAVEKSGVPCFLLKKQTAVAHTSCVTRWQVTPQPSRFEDGLPGVAYPRWQVKLLKVRNGQPGVWELEWRNGRLRYCPALKAVAGSLQKKAV